MGSLTGRRDLAFLEREKGFETERRVDIVWDSGVGCERFRPGATSTDAAQLAGAHGGGDAVEAALAAVLAIAASMARAAPSDLGVLADRLGTLARELECRRVARAGAKVVSLADRRR